jgi:hydrophobic/amphiphilic exporter-1 (mainly G- bacteria), HAE1 family
MLRHRKLGLPMARSLKEKLNGMIISDTSIRQPVFITMLMLLGIVIGLLSYSTLPVNLLPDISVPYVFVSVPYPGAGPESVADQVAKPIEDQLNTLPGVKHITSNSSEGIATIIVEFDTSVDPIRAEQDVRDKVNTVRPRLPQDVRDPVLQRIDINDAPIITLAVASKGSKSSLELRRIVDDDIVPRLQRVQGVGAVDVSGGAVRQVNVQMDLNKLKAWQVLPVQITRAIQSANANRGLGTIVNGTQDISLRAPSQIQKPEDIARIQITGTPYQIGDVATIEDGVAEPTSYARLDGEDAIAVAIRKQSGSNTVAVADGVKAQLNDIFAAEPDLNYFIPNDQSTAVKESTNGAIEELLIAAISAMLVVLLFFRDIRNTLVTVAGLPVILIATFAALQLFGQSVNLLTLLALSLSVGLVIDDAIVVRENIFRHMERGETPLIASSRGTAQVALSVLAMSLTIIAVFLPVTFTSGITGLIFKAFGITVASAMAISLVEAFTLAPMLSAYFFKQKTVHAGSHVVENPTPEQELLEEAAEDPGAMGRFYGRVLGWSLRHRLAVVGIFVAFVVASIVVANGLKFSFFPTQDPGYFLVGYTTPPGTTLSETDRLARQAEAIIRQDPEVEAVQTTVGGAGTTEHAEFFVKLHEGQSTRPAEERLRPQLEFLPKLVFGQPSVGGGSSTAVERRPLAISIQTTRSIEELAPLLLQLQPQLGGVPGLVDIDTTYNPGKPELRFLVDPAKTGDLGVTNDDIATSVRALINGDRASTLRQGGDDTDILVRLKESDRAGVDSLRGISVPTRAGSVPLSSLVKVEVGSSLTSIRRYDKLNQVVVAANIAPGYNLQEVQAQIQAGINQANLPNDVFVSFIGQSQQTTEGFTTLFIAMGLSVLFVYMVLASQFGSFLQPLVIMLAMPFSFIGAFMALRLVRLDLDITGMIGLIMLLGLVTKNSILLVDFTNRLRDAGLEKHAALEASGAIRLRPILMTTIALVVGSIPSAIGIGEGAEFRRGLSTVVIGGLITSMLLTLLIVPTAYSLLDSATQRTMGLFRRRPKPVAVPEAAAPSAPTQRAEANSTPHGTTEPVVLPVKEQ